MATQLLLAKSPDEAVRTKTAAAAFLAGGTEVNRLGSDAAEYAELLISLKKCCGLSEIKEDAGFVTIGAMCTFQNLVESDKVPGYLKDAAHYMASRTKRNMATIGGNIAAMRTDSYLIPTLIAAGAVLELCCKAGDNARIEIEKYLGEKDAFKDALISSVTVPSDLKVISKRYANTEQSHAVITMSASVSEDGFALAAAVKNSGIYRLTDFEKAIQKDPSMTDDQIIEWFKAYTEIPVSKDMFGGVEYKRYLLGVTAADMYRKLTGCTAQ